jgi:hypothetical protein
MVEQRFVHWPKICLFGGSFGSFGCVLGMWMGVRQREMPESKTEMVSKPPLNLSDNRLNFAAERAFVVSVLQQ